jgi:hypothetical protein
MLSTCSRPCFWKCYVYSYGFRLHSTKQGCYITQSLLSLKALHKFGPRILLALLRITFYSPSALSETQSFISFPVISDTAVSDGFNVLTSMGKRSKFACCLYPHCALPHTNNNSFSATSVYARCVRRQRNKNFSDTLKGLGHGIFFYAALVFNFSGCIFW